ncbi:surface antigen-domain-containing protein [Phellopilus nigrolimitatus]|nr:surface antigen-domain-containing protein [Phellopilus nigrolimitatus]
MTEPVSLAERFAPPLANTSAPYDGEPDMSDFEKVRKWQEERVERRLKGEYESAILYLADLIKANMDTPMRIASVRVRGAAQTRPAFLSWLIKPHLDTTLHADISSLKDVLQTTKHLTNTLLDTDIFAAVLPRIQASRDALASSGDVDLVFDTRHKGRYFLKTSTELGDQEGSVTIQGRARNAFGGAESLEAAISSGLKTRLAGLHRLISSPHSVAQDPRGALRTVGRRTTSEFAYEAALRHIHTLTPTASISIREAAGHSVKSALSHVWTFDSRDDKAVPSRGSLFRSYHELAGLGGSVAFFKSSLAFQTARSLLTNSTLSFSARTGYIYPLSSSPDRVPRLADRFTLGGPLDVRMFHQNGLGPRDGSDALGGDLFWAAGVSLISDLPKRSQWPVKTHFFLNAGHLDGLNREIPLLDSVRSCVSRPSISAGIGLLYRLDPVRVEFNFGVPVAANRSDAHRRGFQIGIGLDYL